MFHLFKKYKHKVKQNLYALTDGTLLPLDKVHDQIFSNHVMGEGFALYPENHQIYSPASGTVTMLFPTKHAIGLTLDNGLELLIHLGIDTVELDGKPFELFVNQGEHIEAGALLATMDCQMIQEMGKTCECIVVCTNGQSLDALVIEDYKDVKAKESIGNILNK